MDHSNRMTQGKQNFLFELWPVWWNFLPKLSQNILRSTFTCLNFWNAKQTDRMRQKLKMELENVPNDWFWKLNIEFQACLRNGFALLFQIHETKNWQSWFVLNKFKKQKFLSPTYSNTPTIDEKVHYSGDDRSKCRFASSEKLNNKLEKLFLEHNKVVAKRSQRTFCAELCTCFKVFVEIR